MNKKKTRRIFPLIYIPALAVLVLVVIVATLIGRRSSDIDHDSGQSHETVQKYFIDEYIFLAQSGFMHLDTGNAEMINSLVVYDELIYYLYLEYIENPIMPEQAESPDTWEPFPAVIQIKGIDQSGTVIDSITVSTALPNLNVIGFDIGRAGEISIVTQEFDLENKQGALCYSRYDFTGNLMLRAELLQTGTNWFAQEVYFEENGAIAIVGLNSHFNSIVLLWDDKLAFIREEPILSSSFTFTSEGTYLHLVGESTFALQETELATGARVKEYPFPLYDATSIYKAGEDNIFDYYLVSEQHVYGYDVETGDVELILDFLESYLNLSTRYHIAFLTDGSVAVSQERAILETQTWIVELAILSPVERSSIVDRDHIILAGFRFRPFFIDQVMEYNRRSSHVQIIVHDYWDIDDKPGFRQAIDRFHYDIIAGNMPDIILFEDSAEADLIRARDALVEKGALLDLYQLIDEDPVLRREDFFPNILHGYESADATLPMIGNQLDITSMVSADPSLLAENWRVDDFLTVMEKSVAAGNLEPLGRTVTGVRFLTTMLDYMGNEFIDYESGLCNFECDNFIRLLELTAAIPTNLTFADLPIDYYPNFVALQSGSQVVDLVGFAGIPDWVDGEGNSLAPETFNYIGIPGSSGGVHCAQLWGTFSIFANSQNSDAAWQYIREDLLPGATRQNTLTLRVDDFEDRVTASLMKADQKAIIRDIINQAVVHRPLNGTILMIVEEEYMSFFRGTQTAAETARIIQSRVQIYLHERS